MLVIQRPSAEIPLVVMKNTVLTKETVNMVGEYGGDIPCSGNGQAPGRQTQKAVDIDNVRLDPVQYGREHLLNGGIVEVRLRTSWKLSINGAVDYFIKVDSPLPGPFQAGKKQEVVCEEDASGIEVMDLETALNEPACKWIGVVNNPVRGLKVVTEDQYLHKQISRRDVSASFRKGSSRPSSRDAFHPRKRGIC